MNGVLFFPVTPFDASDQLNVEVFEEHLSRALAHSPGAVFPACGTGELHALDEREYDTLVSVAVAAVGGSAPVIAGTGGSVAQARSMARAAAKRGADALLVLPPYLVSGPQRGMVSYVQAVASASDLPVIVYNRGLATFTPASIAELLEDPRIIGVKDGVGNIAAVQQFTLAASRTGRDVLFFNGLLTAELSQRAYASIGVPLYSSAVFAMVPEVASSFFEAYVNGDTARQADLLTHFYEPLVRLRDRVPGYGVSLIKAGLRLRGLDVGSVRPPLVDPSPDDLRELERLLSVGVELAG
nr:5-dehydro-4-deoxyglucarate dehydratase [Microbacterium yannicii]